MGLDMYLSAKKYYSGGTWGSEADQKTFIKLKAMSGVGLHMTTDLPSVQLEVSVGYWRKANAVHQFFVGNCQNGEDDCRTSYVGRDKLEELKVLCEQIVLTPALAGEQLPTTEGFFFGSTEYGEYYIDDLNTTIEIVERCLQMPDDWEFYYHSSW